MPRMKYSIHKGVAGFLIALKFDQILQPFIHRSKKVCCEDSVHGTAVRTPYTKPTPHKTTRNSSLSPTSLPILRDSHNTGKAWRQSAASA